MDGFVAWLKQLQFDGVWQTAVLVAASLLCITFHETCHGLVAYWLGDPTAKRAGRLTLNPLRHIDIGGLLMMALFRFGWAKPVPRWEKLKMDKNMEEMTQYVQERTVSLHVRTVDGSETVEAGFFIDEDGTIATTWNAIEGASEITAIVDNGGKFSVSQIVDFSQALNLAILKIDIRSSKCLKLSDEAMQDDDAIYMADPRNNFLER